MKPIRVLCLFTIMNRGGAETMCMNLYRHIDRSKVQFDFLVYHPEKGSYEDEINELGGNVYRIPHLKNIAAHIKGARAFFSDHPEYGIVHNHMQSNGALICREAKRAGVPTIIYHSHFGPVPTLGKNPIYVLQRIVRNGICKLTWKDYTDFFACGRTAAEAIPSKYKHHILFNAIDVEKFRFSKPEREAVRNEFQCGEKLIIGNVARFNVNKNQIFAIDVFEALIKCQADSELWLVGDGERRIEIERYIHSKGLEDRIRLLGVRSDVSRLLQAMDVYLFPSIREGLPVACIEAQASGLPCVFSDGFDPTTDITGNCKTVSLKEPPEVWANALLDYLDFQRQDTSEKIRAAGYDILETSKIMGDYYISHS